MARATPFKRSELPAKSPAKTSTKSAPQVSNKPASSNTNGSELANPSQRESSPIIPSTEPTNEAEAGSVQAAAAATDAAALDNDHETFARQVRSSTPSPESASRRRHPNINANANANIIRKHQAVHIYDASDDVFGDDGLDDETLAALASSAEREAREGDPNTNTNPKHKSEPEVVAVPFGSSLPDSELLLAVKAVDEGKKEGK